MSTMIKPTGQVELVPYPIDIWGSGDGQAIVAVAKSVAATARPESDELHLFYTNLAELWPVKFRVTQRVLSASMPLRTLCSMTRKLPDVPNKGVEYTMDMERQVIARIPPAGTEINCAPCELELYRAVTAKTQT